VNTASEATFAPANGIRLCYQTFGDPSHPAMLLIMGLAVQMIVWDDDFCELLAARGFWVIRFDNRDMGKSTTFPHARTPSIVELLLAQVTRLRFRVPYTLRDMAADAVGLLDALGIAKAHVVGASMGGMIAQEMAIAFPGRVTTLTSLMSSTGDPRLPRAQGKALRALAKPTPRDRAGFVQRYVETWAVLAGDGYPYDPDRMARQGGLAYDRGINPAGAARQMLAIIASGNRKKALHGLTVPTLVIHGTLDPLVPVGAGPDTARSIPGAQLLLIDGMGHWMPREVWPRIVDAIAQHASGA
jgi:pimeloyl-ACP methyl ester carboxylesterase